MQIGCGIVPRGDRGAAWRDRTAPASLSLCARAAARYLASMKLAKMVLSGLVVVAACTARPPSDDVGVTHAALTEAQCDHFEVGGKVQI